MCICVYIYIYIYFSLVTTCSAVNGCCQNESCSIMDTEDLHFSQKQWFLVNFLSVDLFITNIQFFTSQDVL